MAKKFNFPLYHDGERFTPVPDGQFLDPSLIPVSDAEGNVLSVKDGDGLYVPETEIPTVTVVSKDGGNVVSEGSDGGALLTNTGLEALMQVYLLKNPVDPVSTDSGNMVRYGTDKAAYLDANDVLSNGGVNLLTVDSTDGKVILTSDAVAENVDFVSAVDGNLLKRDADGKYYVTIDELFASDDPLLYVNECGEIATGLSLQYDTNTGTFSLVNHEGSVISSVTVAPTLAVLKNVELDGTDLVFTFALADGTERVLRVDLKSFVDVYQAGDGLKLEDGTFSVDLAQTGHLYVNSNGRLAVDADSLVSDEDGNGLTVDGDGRLFVKNNEYHAGTAMALSTDNYFSVRVSHAVGNKLSVVDDALYAEGIGDVSELLSADSGNAAKLGSDGGLYVSCDHGTME